MNKSDITRDYCMLKGPLAKKGYDWWWHSFTAEHVRTGERKSFYIEYFLCNPALAQEQPMLVWNDPEGRQAGKRPSYCMINVGFWEREGPAPPLFPLEPGVRSPECALEPEGRGLHLHGDAHDRSCEGDAGGGCCPSGVDE